MLTEEGMSDIMSSILYGMEEYDEDGDFIEGILLKEEWSPHNLIAEQEFKCKYFHRGGLREWERELLQH